jgi:arylsulfatase A-like enzyme
MKFNIYHKVMLFIFLAAVLINCKSGNSTQMAQFTTPNIIIIYTDDLGYGDVSSYTSTELITPNIDALAEGGLKFTNGYASSATCTPSRYALLTGIYPWRNSNAKILPGSAPLLIDTNQMTLPKMLKTKGYHTSIVGKWHLGLGDGQVNWNERVSPGPNEVGFDYSYIMAATQDRVPTVYIENGQVEGIEKDDPIYIDYDKNFEGEPTGLDNPELLKMKWHHGHNNSIVNGIPRIGFMKGGEKAKWIDEDMADIFLIKAQDYIKDKSKEKDPFFLYYAMQQPHVPRTPHPRFIGKSGMGSRGDVILELDWCVGELVKTLEDQGILENTLIIFSSDNGPVLNDGYYDDAVELLGKHDPFGGLRGGKYSLYEAGTKVPFIAYWKGKIKPAVSDALICQIDFLSSFAKLVNSDITTDDSENLMDLILGKTTVGRKELILEATTKTAFRSGDYVMIPPYKGAEFNMSVNIEVGNTPNFQLYNLTKDPGQKQNLAKENPEKLDSMITAFEAIRGKDYGKTEQLILK